MTDPRKSRRRRKNHTLEIILTTFYILVVIVGIAFIAKRVGKAPSTAPEPKKELPASQTETPEVPVTQETEPKPDPAEEAAAAQETLREAERIAAGYDYDAAITLLKTVGGWESSPSVSAKISEFEQAKAQLAPYPDMSGITHIFFHSLIADTDRAFDGGSASDGYNLYMTTIAEFNEILQEMYDRGYVLVTPYDVAGEEQQSDGSTKFAYRQIMLPPGKRPFMMSQDDLNYYGYMIGDASGVDETPVFATPAGDGFASRIVIDENGDPTCEYMDAQGNVLYGDYDLVPCLETFIREHPDFSYRGARATLGMTGYEGVFGYRTKPSYEAALGSERYQKEVADAKAVAQCLREHGYVLASHSYGHPAYGNVDPERVEIDSNKWENTVQPIIGDCDVLIYPHGSDIAGIEKYTMDNAKFVALYDDGYRYFFNVDNTIAWHQMGDHYFRGNRRDLDGYRMYHYPNATDDIIDASSILDPARPLPVPEL